MRWINFFVNSVHATGSEGHIGADVLRERISMHNGDEAYHCAFDLEERENLNNYVGPARPALGYVWFDFDSKDVSQAQDHSLRFVGWLGVPVLIYFSGSKGFHVGVPFGHFGLQPDEKLPEKLNRLAKQLKKSYSTLDTTIYNPNRKFRVPGSRHPKTGLYKIQISREALLMPLEGLQALASKSRGIIEVPLLVADTPLEKLTSLLATPTTGHSISLVEWRKYKQPRGEEAFKQCQFLSYARDNSATLLEPEWYAAASIVGRFENGRTQFHAISKGHASYSKIETDEKLEQALQASGPRTCEGVQSVWGKCTECPLWGRIKSPIQIMEADVIRTESTGFYDLTTDENGKIKRAPNYGDLLKAFKREFPYKTIADMKTVYAFNGTHYAEKTPIEIKGFAEEKFDPQPKENMRAEFLSKVFANSIDKKSFFGRGIENKINFKNGVLDLETKELEPHSPNFGFRGVLPYDFDPEASCPTFDWWIHDIMFGDGELIAILQEFMGYVLRGGEYKYHKALWLAGTGRNGKSTFIDVLKDLIGNDNYSTLSIKQIIQDKFSSASLDGKIANFSEETSPEELSDSGPFKNLTGDGELEAQKKFGDPYRFRNRAKLIMSYNEVPMLKDLSPGMLSRPIIIPFKKDLTAEEAQDKSLKKKLLMELPGIFNFALKGWERLEENEQFTRSEKSLIEMEEIRDASCTAAQWAKENLIFLPMDNAQPVKPRALYSAYKAEIGQYAYAEQKFYKRIQAIPNVALRKRRTNHGVEYFGMRLKTEKEKTTDY